MNFACLLVANHASYLDGLGLMLALPGPVAFVAAAEFASRLASGTLLKRLGCEFVTRRGPREAIPEVSRLADVVRSGRSIVLFPEGSPSRAPGLRPFRLGAFKVAAAAGVPVVPVGNPRALETSCARVTAFHATGGSRSCSPLHSFPPPVTGSQSCACATPRGAPYSRPTASTPPHDRPRATEQKVSDRVPVVSSPSGDRLALASPRCASYPRVSWFASTIANVRRRQWVPLHE